MNAQARIGLIIPSSNRLTEPQFNRYAPRGVDIHVTRLRMTGKYRKPLNELKRALVEASEALSDVDPGIIARDRDRRNHRTSQRLPDSHYGASNHPGFQPLCH
jgi:hypothetical protein